MSYQPPEESNLQKWSRSAGWAGAENELDIEATLKGVVLRNFLFTVEPLYGGGLPPYPVDGLGLRFIAQDTGLVVSLRFERSEFVNLATAGLQMLDAADEIQGGGD